jgi:hypothetical protein
MKVPVSMLISDVHTRYQVVNTQIAHAELELGHALEQVFVLGDFGFFREPMHDFFRRGRGRFTRAVTSIEGNHEDHGALPGLVQDYQDVLGYRGRGSVHQVSGWGAMCLGGARYMDAAATPRGCEVTSGDLEKCLAVDPDQVDLVLTHDCPCGLGVPGAPGLEHYGPPGVPGLARLADHFQPRYWFFGHHHRWFDHRQGATRYLGLPQSWRGYLLLDGQGQVTLVDHEVSLRPASRWVRWLRPGQW